MTAWVRWASCSFERMFQAAPLLLGGGLVDGREMRRQGDGQGDVGKHQGPGVLHGGSLGRLPAPAHRPKG